MTARMRAWVLVLTGLIATPWRPASAFCSGEASPCYSWDHYVFNGGSFCRHWNIGSLDNDYLIGLASGIGPANFLNAVRSAHDNWVFYSTNSLPNFSYLVAPPPDTTTVSYWMFVDDATWLARGFNPNAGGVTYRRVFSNGVVAHGRTWLHMRPSLWRWSPDCLSENCAANGLSVGALDLPTIAAHETGHWWVLKDISTAGCESVLMWGQISTNQVKRLPTPADAIGATLLYDQPVDTRVSVVSAEAAPEGVSVRWKLSGSVTPAALTVERNDLGGDWTSLANPLRIDSDGVTLLDREVTPGRRYGYRLRDGASATLAHEGEVWVDVPVWALSVKPDPAWPLSAGQISLRLVLPSRAAARVELLDVSGRLVRSISLQPGTAGVLRVNVADVSTLRQGVYWARVIQLDRSASAKLSVLR